MESLEIVVWAADESEFTFFYSSFVTLIDTNNKKQEKDTLGISIQPILLYV